MAGTRLDFSIRKTWQQESLDIRHNISCWINVARGVIALPRLLRCRHGSAIRSKHTAATYFLGLALDDTPYWRNTRFGTLQRICWQNAKFGTRRRSFGQNARFGTRRRAFAGRIAGFGIFSWQDGRFGTRPLARSAVWYPRKRVVVFVTWGFFGPWVPNRRS